MNTKCILAIGFGLISQSIFINRGLAGTVVTTIGGIAIMDGGVDMSVKVVVPNTTTGGSAIDYANGDNTDPSNIHTKKGRYFDHLWMNDISYPMWVSAYNPTDLSIHPVNSTTIRAHWDNYYANLATGYGNTKNGPTVASNCHGYSMGYSTWVQDNTYIVADDFKNATGWSDCTELINANVHSVKESGYSQVGPSEGIFLYGFFTNEKNQASDIYTNYWFNGTGYPSRIPSNATTQLKPQ
jgi:hypothetical protein